MPDDRERGHQDDDRDDHEQGELLQLERREQVAVHVHPVADPVGPVQPARDGGGHVLGVEGVGQLHLDAGDPVPEPGELLGRRQRGVRERHVVLVHADLDVARHQEASHLGDEPDRGHRALRGDHRDVVARDDAQAPGQLPAEQQRGLLALQQGFEAAEAHLGGERVADRGAGGVHAAQEAAGGPAAGRGEERLLEHEGGGRHHARDRGHPLGESGAVRHSASARLHDQDVGVRRDDPVADAVLEAGHHRQHHDEGADPEEHPADADPDE